MNNSKGHISTSTRQKTFRLGRMVTEIDGLQLTKSYFSLLMLSGIPRDKKDRYFSTFTIIKNTRLVREETQGDGLQLIKSHVSLIMWPRHVT